MGMEREVWRSNAMAMWRERQYENMHNVIIRIPTDEELSEFCRKKYEREDRQAMEKGKE